MNTYIEFLDRLIDVLQNALKDKDRGRFANTNFFICLSAKLLLKDNGLCSYDEAESHPFYLQLRESIIAHIGEESTYMNYLDTLGTVPNHFGIISTPTPFANFCRIKFLEHLIEQERLK